MIFKLIKSGFDGLCGEYRCDSIDEALTHIVTHRGWESREQLHESIRKWAKQAGTGSIFSTQVTAIIAVGVDKCSQQDDICPFCGEEELDYKELGPVEGGEFEQEVSCPHCNKRWMDVFVLSDRRELVSRTR